MLQSVFKHTHFRSKQREIILSLLAGNDVFVLMPTGSIS
jgi:superfamily II DNA helicase RecQ